MIIFYKQTQILCFFKVYKSYFSSNADCGT